MKKDVDNTNQSPTILSLCSGSCGLERGIERAAGKLNVAAYVEVEAFIIENLLSLMEQGILAPAPVWANLKTFPSEAFRGKIHGIVGGYPCQPFSHAGSRKGTEDPRHLWPHIQRIIAATNPVWCFFENVSGHLSLGFDEVYRSLAGMGYTVEAGLYTAAEVGAPHKRTRLFILAVRTSELGHTKHHGHATGANRGRHAQNNERCQEGKNVAEQLAGTSELEYTTEQGLQKCGQTGKRKLSKENRRGLDNRPKQPSAELATTNHHGYRTTSGRAEETPNNIKGTLGEPIGQWVRSQSWQQSTDVPYANSYRLQRIGEKWNGAGSIGLCGRAKPVEGWPLGHGPYQHTWEAPRTIGYTNRLPNTLSTMWRNSRTNFAQMLGTKIWKETDHYLKAVIKPRLGCTINGYNFREDLLRMYGNGVVEQTAELAWNSLWDKILNEEE